MKIYLPIFVFIITFLFTSCSNKDVSKENLLQEKTVHDAIRVNDQKLLNSFIEEKIDLNKKDKYGYTPVHLAARFNHFFLAQILIQNGVNINTQDIYGDSPLLDSTRNGYSEMSKLLVCNGANKDIEDKYKMTPLDYSIKSNNLKLVKFLKSKNLEDICPSRKKSSNPEFIDLISIDNYSILTDNTPKICGDILNLSLQRVQITFNAGEDVIDAKLDKKSKRWCAQSENRIEDGKYTLMAMGINSKGQKGKAQIELEIQVVDKLNKDGNNKLK